VLRIGKRQRALSTRGLSRSKHDDALGLHFDFAAVMIATANAIKKNLFCEQAACCCCLFFRIDARPTVGIQH
jgi:hypothetical protein